MMLHAFRLSILASAKPPPRETSLGLARQDGPAAGHAAGQAPAASPTGGPPAEAAAARAPQARSGAAGLAAGRDGPASGPTDGPASGTAGKKNPSEVTPGAGGEWGECWAVWEAPDPLSGLVSEMRGAKVG